MLLLFANANLTTALGSDIYDDGFKNIISTDFSPAVIADMQAQNSGRPEMKCLLLLLLCCCFEGCFGRLS
jgi:hypothetical protein